MAGPPWWLLIGGLVFALVAEMEGLDILAGRSQSRCWLEYTPDGEIDATRGKRLHAVCVEPPLVCAVAPWWSEWCEV